VLRLPARRRRATTPGPLLTLDSAVATDVGPRRSNNEDVAFAGRRLLAIADGMGGMPDGEVASDLAIRALAVLETARQPISPDLLRHRFLAAADDIRAAIRETADRAGMGTTLTALLISPEGERCVVSHIGDSRCYLLRDSRLVRLTRDDSYVQMLVDQGQITEMQARVHPHRSYITHALQGERAGPSMATILRVEPGDVFLLCSDGLTDAVEDEAIADVLAARPGPLSCAQRLVRLALDRGTSDNVTAVVAQAVRTTT
jgi:protein phosphatase